MSSRFVIHIKLLVISYVIFQVNSLHMLEVLHVYQFSQAGVNTQWITGAPNRALKTLMSMQCANVSTIKMVINVTHVRQVSSSDYQTGLIKTELLGKDFESAESTTCVEVTCEFTCNKQCTDNPSENGECKCISTGWGPQCVTCPPGLYSSQVPPHLNIFYQVKNFQMQKPPLVPIFHATISVTKTVRITQSSTTSANVSAPAGATSVSDVHQVSEINLFNNFFTMGLQRDIFI